MASFIKYFTHGWTQIHKKRDGSIVNETTKYSEDGNTSITVKERQNSVSGDSNEQ